MFIEYWAFEEDRLIRSLAHAVECGDITSDQATVIRNHMRSQHVINEKMFMQIKVKEELS